MKKVKYKGKLQIMYKASQSEVIIKGKSLSEGKS